MFTPTKSRPSFRAAVCTVVCVCGFSAAHADNATVYKWVDKNGVVSYSQDKPVEDGAHDVATIQIETLAPAQQRAAARMLAHLEKATDAEFAARQKRLKQADARINVALQNLQKAEQRLSAGSTPSGADRVGIVGGHTRLRDSYFDRVASLQSAVDQAQQELNAAYAARDQL